MSRIRAAKEAFQNPEKMSVTLPIIKMTPDPEPEWWSFEATEEQKPITEVLYTRFREQYANLHQLLTENPQDAACINYGTDLLLNDENEPSDTVLYSMLWTAFYLGAGTGLEIYDTIMKGEKNDQSRQL